MLAEPCRPLLAAERAHERGLRLRRLRLGALVGDAVVADHRRREADELARIARVRDRLLVAGHARRKDGLAERAPRGRDGAAAEDRAVLQDEVTGVHASSTSRPSAIVLTTRPRRVS